MTPQQFIAKWQGCQLAERAFYQQHFNALCGLVGHSTPAAQDIIGDTFCLEKGATKTGGHNARPAWLANTDAKLDAAVAAAYGWMDCTPDMRDDEFCAACLR